MSNDKTTLAVVQPGGRVRLGDGRVTGEMVNAARCAFGTQPVNERGDERMRNALEAALSAKASPATCKEGLQVHPSPGGQDALAALQQDYDKLLDSFDRRVEVAEKIAGRVLQQDDRIEELEEALAASQPVGQEPVGFQFRSRQWSDEEFSGPWLTPNVTDRGHYDSRPANYETRSIYAAPPAQAVDLGMQQDAARWRAIAPHLSVEWDEDEMLKRWTWIDFKGDALSVPTRTRESYASVEEAIDAVIDSQAVGNG